MACGDIHIIDNKTSDDYSVSGDRKYYRFKAFAFSDVGECTVK